MAFNIVLNDVEAYETTDLRRSKKRDTSPGDLRYRVSARRWKG
jgi:hypothetical protein